MDKGEKAKRVRAGNRVPKAKRKGTEGLQRRGIGKDVSAETGRLIQSGLPEKPQSDRGLKESSAPKGKLAMAYLSKTQKMSALLKVFERVKKEQQFVKDCTMIPPPPVVSEEVKLLVKQVAAN